MPQLIIKGMKKEDVKLISTELVDELQSIVECPRDYFTLEVPETSYIADGEDIVASPLIQVNWFGRGQEVQDLTAEAITRHIQQAGYQHIEIFFIVLEENRYYENGEHY